MPVGQFSPHAKVPPSSLDWDRLAQPVSRLTMGTKSSRQVGDISVQSIEDFKKLTTGTEFPDEVPQGLLLSHVDTTASICSIEVSRSISRFRVIYRQTDRAYSCIRNCTLPPRGQYSYTIGSDRGICQASRPPRTPASLDNTMGLSITYRPRFMLLECLTPLE